MTEESKEPFLVARARRHLVERLVIAQLNSSSHWPAFGRKELEQIAAMSGEDARQRVAELIVDMARRLAELIGVSV